MTEFLLNGASVRVDGDHPHLLSALREELGVTSPKDGCSPSGQCGCCAVLIDSKATFSCKTALEKVAGRSVTTLEGLPDSEREQLATAYASTGALQCGFCTPGIVIRTKELLDKHGAQLTRDLAANRLGAHLCRCTGYVKILDAIELLASGEAAEAEPIKGIGSSGLRYQGTQLSLGERGFVDDLRADGMLHGYLRLADHARADVVRIDTSAAEAMPGVEAVLTAADVPGELKVGLIHKDWPVFIPEGGRTSYFGDVIAMAVADTREHARAAAEAIAVEYRPHRSLTDPVAAIDDPEPAVWGTEDNVLSRSAYCRGDVDAALAGSAHVVHEVFETQRVDQAFLEPEATFAVPGGVDGRGDEDPLYVYSGGQGVWDDRDQIASVLGVDKGRVVVELVTNGGAFGGKEDMINQAQTALAAWLLKRPVKCALTREQSFLMHAKRHPIRMEYWAGCDEDGRLTAVKARMVGDSGAYASVGMKVLERAAGHATGPYTIPNVDVESIAARTNNPVCGAFRGFGANQAQFAMEGVIDRLAEQAGIDPWELRWRNAVEPGSIWGPGQIMDDGCLGAKACLEAIKPHYDVARAQGRAVGLGLGLKNSGLGNGFKEIAKATVRFDEDGTVVVRHCWTEMGQGVHSVAVAVAVEELGVDAERVRVVVDTSRELGAGQTTGSRGTLMGAGAIRDACEKARAAGCPAGVEFEGAYRVDWTNSLSDGVENPTIHSTFGYACQMAIVDDDGAVEKIVAAHDVGRAVNPLLCEGQVEGSVHMGLGYALTEDFPADENGRPLNLTISSLGIIRPKDMPEVETILVECPQPNAPYGVKGVGEIGLVPTAPAVAAALHAWDGKWRNRLPMRPKKGLVRRREEAGVT